jgi:hypothetical protein
MNTPKSPNNTLKNAIQPYFTSTKQTTQIINNTTIKLENSNTPPGNSYTQTNPNPNNNYPRPSIRPSLSLNIP